MTMINESGTRAHVRPHKRPARAQYQPCRIASLRDQVEAYRAGTPISGDRRFQNAEIYFAVSKCCSLLKVGISNQPAKRVLQVGRDRGVEMEIWFTVPGNRQEEMRCLEALAAFGVGGEWFRFCGASVAAVQDLRSYYGLPPYELRAPAGAGDAHGP